MDRLLSSPSPPSVKTFTKSFPFLIPFQSATARINLSPLTRSDLKRVTSICCKYENPSLFSSSKHPNGFPSISSSPDRPPPEPHSLNQIKTVNVQKPKAIPARILITLSALALILIQPAIAPAAFATFQTAAKTGGPAAAAVGGKLIQSELLSSGWTGFLAGCLHTLSGPDHLAALAPLSIGRTRMESAAVGALWGCGHDAGQVLFGLIFLILKDQLHIEIIRTWGTRVVGLTLLVIGAMGIREASEVHTPRVALESGECESVDNPTVGIEAGVIKKLKAKEEEIEKIGKLNWALEEKVKSLCMENQIWRDLAQTNEATANALRRNLEQVLAQRGMVDDGDAAALMDDAESCCGSTEEDGEGKKEVGWRTIRRGCASVKDKKEGGCGMIDESNERFCRNCGKEESCVLILPCRHLCLCTVCGSTLHICPICKSFKTASVHVNMS